MGFLVEVEEVWGLDVGILVGEEAWVGEELESLCFIFLGCKSELDVLAEGLFFFSSSSEIVRTTLS